MREENKGMTNTTDQNMHDAVLSFMRRNSREGAMWTGDIAIGAKMRTESARSVLKTLEGKDMVRRVVVGNPTSWELVDA